MCALLGFRVCGFAYRVGITSSELGLLRVRCYRDCVGVGARLVQVLVVMELREGPNGLWNA